MREDAKTFQAEASAGLNQSVETELREWKQPTLTTWEVPKETQFPAPHSGNPA